MSTDEFVEPRQLAKTLTKSALRAVLRHAFPGVETAYGERREGMQVAGVLLVGTKASALVCRFGQERHMRQAFLETIRSAHREAVKTDE